MRGATLAVLAVVGTMMVAPGGPNGAAGRVTAAGDTAGAGGLMTVVTAADEGGQQLVLVDPRERVMGVYHIERATGAVQLKSVRNFRWDLRLMEFNGANPRPREIRAMVGNQ